jgi:hypothetical protein
MRTARLLRVDYKLFLAEYISEQALRENIRVRFSPRATLACIYFLQQNKNFHAADYLPILSERQRAKKIISDFFLSLMPKSSFKDYPQKVG